MYSVILRHVQYAMLKRQLFLCIVSIWSSISKLEICAIVLLCTQCVLPSHDGWMYVCLFSSTSLLVFWLSPFRKINWVWKRFHMSVIASQITGNWIGSTVCSCSQQIKQQSFALMSLLIGIHRFLLQKPSKMGNVLSRAWIFCST